MGFAFGQDLTLKTTLLYEPEWVALRNMADQLETIKGITVLRDRLDINMVFFTLSEDVVKELVLVEGLYERNIKVNGTEEGEYRFVTNNGVTRDDVDKLILSMKEII